MDPIKLTSKRAAAMLQRADDVRRDMGVHHVHQIRVACRRLAQAIGMLQGILSKEEIKRARKTTNRIRRVFGDLRDADVLMMLLRDWLTEHPREMAETVAAAYLITTLATQRRRDTLQALRDLESPKLARDLALIDGLTQLQAPPEEVEEEDAAPKTGPKKASRKKNPATSGLNRLQRALIRTRAKVDALMADGPLDCTPEGIERSHDVRIVFKSYRYAAEALSDTFPKEDRSAFMAPFKAGQEALGEVQDASVLLDRIDETLRTLPKAPRASGTAHIDLGAGLEAIQGALLGSIGTRLDTFNRVFDEANAALAPHLPT